MFGQYSLFTDITVLDYLSQTNDLAKSCLSDLLKSKQHTGLVQVERTVNKKGTTFIQKFWIRPDRFQAGDIILQGGKNLAAYNNRMVEVREAKMSKTPKEFEWAQDAWDYFGLGYGDEMFPKWENTLDDDEKESIADYTTYKYKQINNYLRGNKELDDWDDWNSTTVQQIIPILEKALDKFELKEDIVVHRKISATNIKRFKVGEIYQDDAFVSTTPIKNSFIPHNYSDEDDEDWDDTDTGKVIDMVIHVKAGKGVGAWIAPLSELEDENEFLLNRGTQFRVKQITSNFAGGHQIELEVIGRDPKELDDLQKSLKHSAHITHLDKFTWNPEDLKLVKGVD